MLLVHCEFCVSPWDVLVVALWLGKQQRLCLGRYAPSALSSLGLIFRCQRQNQPAVVESKRLQLRTRAVAGMRLLDRSLSPIRCNLHPPTKVEMAFCQPWGNWELNIMFCQTDGNWWNSPRYKSWSLCCGISRQRYCNEQQQYSGLL